VKTTYITILIGFSSLAKAYTLSPAETYARCYSQFTGMRVPSNDVRLIDLKSNKINYVEACLNLLKLADLDDDGIAKTKDASGYPTLETQRILQTFNDFHRNWFENLNLPSSSTYELYDPGEMAYHISHALFTTKPYHKIISDENTYESIRYSPTNMQKYKWINGPHWESAIRGWASTIRTLWGKNKYGKDWQYGWWRTVPYNPRVPQTGVLIGFRQMPMDEDPIPFLQGSKLYFIVDPYLNLKRDSVSFKNLEYGYSIPSTYRDDLKTSDLKAHQPYGSGVIGTVPYLLMNHGRSDFWKSDGLVNIPRKWSKFVLKDLLCRELPALRTEDVADMVQPNSVTPFRASNSCMRCHGTMDPMAYGIRNFSTVTSGGGSIQFDENGYQYDASGAETGAGTMNTNPAVSKIYHTPVHIRKYETLRNDTAPLIKPTADVDFYLKAPVGEFNFRTYDGKLIRQQFTDLNGDKGLGHYLKDLDDMYICTAKKYYQFLTGIDVPIYDYTDPSMPQAGPEELIHRNRIINMGKNLKNHQSLQLLLKEIISLDTYKEKGFGAK